MLLQTIGGHFTVIAVRAVKKSEILRETCDNWDMRIQLGHLRKTLKNDDLHLFASNLYVNRVNFNHLSNENSIRDLGTCSRRIFQLNIQEMIVLKNNFMVLTSRILTEFCPKFHFLKSVTPKHIKHRFSNEKSTKSTIIPLPMLDANENNYNDCVKILRAYEEWVYQIYKEAGVVQNRVESFNPPLPGNMVSLPDQTGAHKQATENDPLLHIKIPFADYQLTRVRFAGAKDLLSVAHTSTDRFEHCSPFKPVMWHCKSSLLQICYHILYNAESVNQIDTIKYCREKYYRINVTPKKVLDSYDWGCEKLFISLGKSYTIAALMHFVGMSDVSDYPTQNGFQSNIVHKPLAQRESFYRDKISQFGNEYIFHRNQSPPNGVEEDYVKM